MKRLQIINSMILWTEKLTRNRKNLNIITKLKLHWNRGSKWNCNSRRRKNWTDWNNFRIDRNLTKKKRMKNPNKNLKEYTLFNNEYVDRIWFVFLFGKTYQDCKWNKIVWIFFLTNTNKKKAQRQKARNFWWCRDKKAPKT